MEETSFQFLNRIIDSYAGALCDCEVWIQRWVHVLLFISLKTEENQEQEEYCQESQDMKMELSFEKR